MGAKTVVIGEGSEFRIRKTSAFAGGGGSRTISARVVIYDRMIDVETGQILPAVTRIGSSSTNTSGIALIYESGTAGFNETIVGIASRTPCRKNIWTDF